MNKEDVYIKNRLLELANISYNRNIYTYSDFLNLNELNILNHIINLLPPVDFELTGGNIYAERKIIVFKPQEVFYEDDAPISVLKIEAINSKFADKLNHRDFLGAILNLGINRSKIGDIFIVNNSAYIYVINNIADYIIDSLTKVKHTTVKCSSVENDVNIIQPNLIEEIGTVSSIRLDSLIALAFKKTRNSILTYIEENKVFINGKNVTSNGYAVKEKDIISVRGLGRFVYNRQLSTTKKGKCLISVSLYI